MTADLLNLLFGLAAVLFAAMPAHAARQALVIGNAAYTVARSRTP